jgi:hypothetical protein
MQVPQSNPSAEAVAERSGSCIRLRPEYRGHVWAYDFVEVRTPHRRKFRILTVIARPAASAWRSSLRVSSPRAMSGSALSTCLSHEAASAHQVG